MSARLLEGDAWRVAFSTVSRNATNNRIYQAIGLPRVGDGVLHAFKAIGREALNTRSRRA